MNEAVADIASWAIGVSLGAIFFGGLLWTVRRALTAPSSAYWLAGSFLLRMSVATAGFYRIAAAGWFRLALCLLGFVTARMVMVRLTRPRAIHAT